MSAEMTASSLESFCKAFEGILEGITDENSARRNKLIADRCAMSTIHRLLSVHRDSDSSIADESNAWELNETLLSEWEESAPPSAAVQQLVSLLSKPVIKNVLWTQSQVVECRYWPQLPDVPYEVDDDEGVAVKVVRLVKGNEPLGATIKCDADGCVFVARIIAGGVADRSACIQVRDRVMEVNGASVTGMKPADIVKLLNTDDGSVSFKLIPAEIPTVVNCDETRYVKTLSDYRGSSDKLHPCPEAALSFAQGDILQLVVTEDEHWWQATCLGRTPFAKPDDDSFDGRRRIGLIPSEVLHRKRKSIRDCEGRRGSVKQSSKNIAQNKESALYETVSLLTPCESLIRPIVLIGASGVGRNELKRRLIIANCDRYSTTVPHTSRPPRAHETEGVDYFFVGRSEMEQWIRQGRFLEFGEYKANLYGTLADSVLSLIAQGRTPVLNPHPLALRMLRSCAFKPFVIFVQPPDLDTFKETRAQHRARCMPSEGITRGVVNGHVDSASYPRGFSDAEMEHIVSSSKQLYQLYAHCCDVVLVNGSLDHTFAQLSHILNKLHNQPSWVPSLWVD